MSHEAWLSLGPEWLQSYLDALPRIQAEEALMWAQITMLPYMKKNERSKLLRSWRARARGGSGAYDSEGREVLNTAKQVKAWFQQFVFI